MYFLPIQIFRPGFTDHSRFPGSNPGLLGAKDICVNGQLTFFVLDVLPGWGFGANRDYEEVIYEINCAPYSWRPSAPALATAAIRSSLVIMFGL